MLDADPNEAADAPASVDTGSDATSVTATVSLAPGPAAAPERVDTGFGDLGGTSAPIQQATPAVNGLADACEPDDPVVNLDARVAALLPNKSITNWNAVSAFMEAVVPWPASQQDAGYVNLHYSYPSREDPKVLEKKGGWPKKDLTSFIGSVSFAMKRPARYKDIWYCTSLQSEIKTNAKGKPRAHRLKANAMGLNAIWIDVERNAA